MNGTSNYRCQAHHDRYDMPRERFLAFDDDHVQKLYRDDDGYLKSLSDVQKLIPTSSCIDFPSKYRIFQLASQILPGSFEATKASNFATKHARVLAASSADNDSHFSSTLSVSNSSPSSQVSVPERR